MRADEQRRVRKVRHAFEAAERPAGDEGDSRVGHPEQTQHGGACLGEGAGLLRLVDLGRESAVEVERDEQPLGARELAQGADERLGQPGPGRGRIDVDHGQFDQRRSTVHSSSSGSSIGAMRS